jgi:hypothetical protein
MYSQYTQPMPGTRAAFNTQIAEAQASSDPRFNMKAMDRPGVSRGRGTRAQAGISAAQNLASGIAQAYQTKADDAAYNASNALADREATEMNSLAMQGLRQQEEYSRALNALTRQQNAMDFQGDLLSGLLGTVGNAYGGMNNRMLGSGLQSNWLDNFLGY